VTSALCVQVEVFWIVTPRSMKMEATRSSESWYPTTTLHGVTTQKTTTWISTTAKTSNLALCVYFTHW